MFRSSCCTITQTSKNKWESQIENISSCPSPAVVQEDITITSSLMSSWETWAITDQNFTPLWRWPQSVERKLMSLPPATLSGPQKKMVWVCPALCPQLLLLTCWLPFQRNCGWHLPQLIPSAEAPEWILGGLSEQSWLSQGDFCQLTAPLIRWWKTQGNLGSVLDWDKFFI